MLENFEEGLVKPKCYQLFL